MIPPTAINQIDTSTPEGKLLISALAILTSSTVTITNSSYEFGSSTHPQDALNNVIDLANKVYHGSEYKQQSIINKRDHTIDQILKPNQDGTI